MKKFNVGDRILYNYTLTEHLMPDGVTKVSNGLRKAIILDFDVAYTSPLRYRALIEYESIDEPTNPFRDNKGMAKHWTDCENISLDKEYYREEKLKELGI